MFWPSGKGNGAAVCGQWPRFLFCSFPCQSLRFSFTVCSYAVNNNAIVMTQEKQLSISLFALIIK